MAYVSLYRKHRPQTFTDVVGQEHVTRTLANAVAEDRLHHAYLFTGPRGTGKTSTARILAKALNCENGPTPHPCNACVHCEAITTGSSVDVIEIDAASHGGVDDVRDLRDRVAFAPASARMKVYIVDECHMLSTAGWNAFLKTVEEPPGHVLFVFATTEPHKVLDTITSRTQRFDFRRVGSDVLSQHLRAIGGVESFEFEPGAVELIVRAADGSVRDALSVLDQVTAFTGQKVSSDGAAAVLGWVPEELLAEMAGLVGSHDAGGICALVQRLADEGQDFRQFARDAIEHFRELFLVQAAPEEHLVETTPEREAALRAEAASLGQLQLLRAIDLLADAQAQMRRGNTRLPLEIALVKATLPEASGDPAALAARVERLERTGREGPEADQDATPGQAGPRSNERSEPAAAEADSETDDASATTPAGAGESTGIDLDHVRRHWQAVLDAVRQRTIRVHAFVAEGQPVAVDDGVLTLEFRHAFHAENAAAEGSQQVLGDAMEEVLGERLGVRCVRGDGDPETAPAATIDKEAVAVAETEAAEARGERPDPEQVHAAAIENLTRDLDATVLEDRTDN